MALEWQRLWPRVWLLAGVVSDIPEAGDYFVFEIGAEQFVIAHQADGSIKAFYNVCPHRGNRVCLNERGSVGQFICAFQGIRSRAFKGPLGASKSSACGIFTASWIVILIGKRVTGRSKRRAMREIRALAGEHDLVTLIEQSVLADHDAAIGFAVGKPLARANASRPQHIAGAHRYGKAHVIPGNAANPCDVVRDLMIEPAPNGHGVNAGGDDSAEDGLLGGSGVGVKILRIVAPREFEQLFSSDGVSAGPTHFAENEIFVVTHAASS
jgi:hypothetical protein